ARRAHEERSRLLGVALLQRDLGPQELGPCTLELVDLTRLDGQQENQCGVEVTAVALGGCRQELALRATSGVGRERRGTLEKGGDSRNAAASFHPAGRTLERRGQLLVRQRRGLPPVPSAALRIDLRTGCFPQGSVDSAQLLQPGRPIHIRANQWMAEHHSGAE